MGHAFHGQVFDDRMPGRVGRALSWPGWWPQLHVVDPQCIDQCVPGGHRGAGIVALTGEHDGQAFGLERGRTVLGVDRLGLCRLEHVAHFEQPKRSLAPVGIVGQSSQQAWEHRRPEKALIGDQWVGDGDPGIVDAAEGLVLLRHDARRPRLVGAQSAQTSFTNRRSRWRRVRPPGCGHAGWRRGRRE